MALTNAEKQRRWRERNLVVLTERAEDIAERLIGMADQTKLRKVAALIGDHFKDHPCGKCNGTGLRQLQSVPEGSCTWKKKPIPKVTAPFPCPDCRPAEYFVASGGELRNRGRYVEALEAALDLMDRWAAGETLITWDADAREIRKACNEAGLAMTMTDVTFLREHYSPAAKRALERLR